MSALRHLGCALALLLTAAPTLAETPQRIVALGGVVTEIVVDLGAEDRLIGRDSTSTYPPSVVKLPDVGYVRALSPEGVMALNPDLIIAEGAAGPAEAVSVLKSAGIPYVALPDSHDPAGIVEKIRLVGHAIGREAQAETLAADFTRRMDAVAAKVAGVTQPKRVLFVLGIQGGKVMAGGEGSSADGIIRLAGGVNAAAGFKGYKVMTDEAVLDSKPDVILMMAREGDLAVTNADVNGQAALAATPAAKAGRIVRMDGLLLLGFGPRTPDAVEALHDALYTGTAG